MDFPGGQWTIRLGTRAFTLFLDSCEPAWLEKWIAQGHLPNLARLREKSARYPLHGVFPFTAELPNAAFLTATSPDKLRYWGAFNYDRKKGTPAYVRAYDFESIQSFYDYSPDITVCQFDLPKTGFARLAKGIQILNWGAHGSLNESTSNPPDALPAIVASHGYHPALEKDHVEPWQTEKLDALMQALLEGIETRTAIHLEMLNCQDWDLMLLGYSELHSGAHVFMHLTDESEDPLTAGSGNPHIHRIMQKIDASIGRQLDALGPETSVMIYSTHGMGLNGWDINSMYILPECLHRDAFPERRKQDRSPLPPASLGNWWWADSVWQLTFGNSRAKPRMDEGINYIPATWYARDWPLMRAFALPGFDEGMVRVNVAGRDPHGIVPPDDYEAELIRLRELLSGLTDERTGEPLVTGFFRTRKHALDDSDALPPADLIVEWTCKPCDVAYSPKVGRIGPVPLRRTGGHTRNGFAWFSGPQFVPGEKSPATPYDLGPTLLDMLGFPMPNHFSGQSLLRNAGSSVNPAMFQRL